MNALNQSKNMWCPCIHKNFMDHILNVPNHTRYPRLMTGEPLKSCWLHPQCFLIAGRPHVRRRAQPPRDSQAVWSWPLPWLPSGKRSCATLWHQQGPLPREIGFSNHQIGEFTHHCYAGTRKDKGYSWVQPWFSGGWFQTCLKALNIPFKFIWWFETASTGQGIETINQEPGMKVTSSSFWALEWLDLFFNISHSLMLSTFEGNDVRSCM